DALAAFLRLCRGAPLGLHTAPQRIHENNHVARCGGARLGLRRLETRLLLSQQLYQRGLVVVLERARIEIAGLGIGNVLSKLQHLAGHLHVRDVAEKFLGLAHLVAVAQRRSSMPLPCGSKAMTRSRLASTMRPSATMPLPRMASRMTANASCPTLSVGAM